MYRVLQIEADDKAALAVKEALADSPLPFVVERVADLEQLPATLKDVGVDALLLGLRDQASLDAALARCRQWFASQPIIILASSTDFALARAALRAGAQDVVQHNERSLAVLSRILLYAIERAGAEARGLAQQIEAVRLRAVLDAWLSGTTDTILQTDAAGTIERATPAAAALVGQALPLAPGARLAERLAPAERGRLQAFLTSGADAGPAGFTFTANGEHRLIELQPLALAGEALADTRLFRVAELVAEFTEQRTPTAPIDRALSDTEARPAAPAKPGTAPVASAAGEAAPTARASGKSVQRNPSASGPLAIVQNLAQVATWHRRTTTGATAAFSFLQPDKESAQTLQRLTAGGREDPELALAIDGLRLKGWQRAMTTADDALPDRLLLEVSYATVASRSHFQRLLEDITTQPAGLTERLVLQLHGLPKGILAPALAKAIRSMGSARGKPALLLPDLAADHRSLTLGELSALVIAVEDLKRTLARDAKLVADLLARARGDGCCTIVRGAGGALAEALRSRLGVDLTVDA